MVRFANPIYWFRLILNRRLVTCIMLIIYSRKNIAIRKYKLYRYRVGYILFKTTRTFQSHVTLGKTLYLHTIFCVVFFYIGVNMYQLFKDVSNNRNTKIDSTEFLNVQRIMLRELAKVSAYYKSSNYVVNGDHLLNQLLLQLNVSLNRDLESYVRICGQETERLARVFKLVNPVVSNPEVRSGEFYNADTKEFIILHAEEFDFLKAYEQWDKLVPVKVHTHSFTDTTMGVADGKYTNTLREGGYSVISINLPMLALQYRAWIDKVQSRQDFKTQTVNFIYCYPIVNIQTRHMELAIINRLINTYRNLPVAEFKGVHPITVTNIDSHLDRAIKSRIDIINKGEYKFDQLFNIFDCLKFKTWFNVIRPLDISPVRSVKWVLELQTLNYFEFFVETRGERGYNNQEVKRVLRDLRYLSNDNTYFKSAFPHIESKIDNLKTLLEKY